MYFYDRAEAGRQLAASLSPEYHDQPIALLAVSPGGVVVGNEIAKALHANINLLLTEPVAMPGVVQDQVVGLIDQEGHFTYNDMMPAGLLDEFLTEMHSYIEAQKLQKLHKLTRAVGDEGFIDPHIFAGQTVIIVSDGFRNGLSFEAASHYLKTIDTKKLIAAAPNVSVPAVDRLHILADEIKILDVLEHYLDTDHYFDNNILPDTNILMKEINKRL